MTLNKKQQKQIDALIARRGVNRLLLGQWQARFAEALKGDVPLYRPGIAIASGVSFAPLFQLNAMLQSAQAVRSADPAERAIGRYRQPGWTGNLAVGPGIADVRISG